ncbi:MAG: acetoin utilization protein AcuC [Candidatus Thorarchaeota archaeon]|nr:acetoin utilization protein AcuC [Candidatus Thorarchaeota archaeon]
MTGVTALYDPEKILVLDGMDEIERAEDAPNPFWNRTRFDITWNLPQMAGLTDASNIVIEQMRLATNEELTLFHDRSYVETLDLFGNMGAAFSTRFGLPSPECPIFSNVNEYARYTVGATIDAVLGVAEGRFKNAMSFYGGFHHALPSKGAGFCYLNDCVVAIKVLKQRHPNMNVLYLDTDVHHGDGVQAAFYDDPSVLTISMHEKSMGFFPMSGGAEEIGVGEGKGYSVNIPLPPLTDDVEYARAFEEIVLPLWENYRPDLVFWNVGADAHMNDPLADLTLTLDTYQRLSRTVREMVHLHKQKLVLVGGGGYDPVTTARVWSLILADVSGQCLPSTVPVEWAKLCEQRGFKVTRLGWTDRPPRIDASHLSKIRVAVDRAIDTVKELVFPIHDL